METNQEKFEEVYQSHFSFIYNYICYHVRSYDLADDLTADVFLKAWNSFDKYDGQKAGMKTWLCRIAQNTIIDYTRKQKVRGWQEELSESLPSFDNLEMECVNKALYESVLSEVYKLPDKQKEVVLLKYVVELSNKEIALQLGISESNVGTILYRATSVLKENLRILL